MKFTIQSHQISLPVTSSTQCCPSERFTPFTATPLTSALYKKKKKVIFVSRCFRGWCVNTYIPKLSKWQKNISTPFRTDKGILKESEAQ
jgi:hypothetical protein